MADLNRNLVIAAGVVVLHVLALWALHTGLLRRTVELFVPVQMLSKFIEPPRPVPVAPPVAPPLPPAVTKKPTVKPTPSRPAPAPPLQVNPNPEPAPNAPTAVAAPPSPLPPITAPVAVAAAPVAAPTPAPPAPPRIELPSSDAEYLRNPKPVYPTLSQRRGEEGEVLIELVVAADGSVQKVGIKRSSGFDRLDQAALSAVRNWRFVPGKRAGMPEAMSYVVPIPFRLVSQ